MKAPRERPRFFLIDWILRMIPTFAAFPLVLG